MKVFGVLVALCLLLPPATQAETVTVDFEDPPFSDFASSVLDYDGYRFSSDNTFANLPLGSANTGLFFCPGCFATMERLDGNPFDLLSLELTQFTSAPAERQTELIGTYAAGGTVTAVLDISPEVWSLYTFDDAWLGLSSLQFNSAIGNPSFTSVGVDNITVSAVPVPAAVWLLGSALAGLGALARQRRRRAPT